MPQPQSKRSRRRAMAEINVVPYIDVMLVLLVIFMITAPLLNQGVNVELPPTTAQPLTSKEQEPLIISIDAQGNYYLNTAADPEKPIALIALLDVISTASKPAQATAEQGANAATAATRSVLIKGDKNVDYGKVANLLARLQQAGFTQVGLLTTPNATPSN